ncbi:MAG: DUF2207 domain-containing protein [Clostridia bacterium]|nr:DUF2207 domain-containing protein [Clostridia bacterium]
MKIKNILFILLVSLFLILGFSTNSFAGSQEWNLLNYDVTLNSDGSADIIETWDIDIEETNTIFKQFEIDSSKYSEITDISVTQIEPNRTELKQIYKEQYHVQSGCFYALKINSSTFEIAWNVGLDNSSATRTYELKYTIEDAVKIYKDCTEFYWKFLDTSNEMSADKVTGTIHLPKRVDDLEKLRVWGHGPLNANIEKVSNNTVKFDVEKFDANTMLEVRIVTEENIYKECDNEKNLNKLDSILTEEQKWADEANAKRAKARMLWKIIIVVSIIVGVFFISKVIKYIKAGKELKQKYAYKNAFADLKYFRDIPNEKNATPARAAYLYYFNKNSTQMQNDISKIFSATMLDLALKNIVSFEPLTTKEVKIIIKPENISKVQLTTDEQVVYKLIKNAAGSDNTMTSKELTKYAKKEYDEFYEGLNKLKEIATSYHEQNGTIDEERKKISKKWSTKGIVYIVIMFILLCTGIGLMLFPISIALLVCSIICFCNAGKVCILSEKGKEEELQWKGLKNYMNEFSLLKDKQVPDLVLWEKYLVYATAFGISKKVIEQLKVVYPQMADPNYYNNRSYSYLYLMSDNRFGDNFIGNIDNMMKSVYNAASNAYSTAHSSDSSGSGGGGGFSGGGGGRRWRWPDAEADN